MEILEDFIYLKILLSGFIVFKSLDLDILKVRVYLMYIYLVIGVWMCFFDYYSDM